jgi:pyruvoyl-dependent arginine decarboxylase (PvlArgDC)
MCFKTSLTDVGIVEYNLLQVCDIHKCFPKSKYTVSRKNM